MSVYDYLATAATTACRCWAVRRRDGFVLGFTDHDRDLSFDGMVFRAETGMTAHSFQQSTGLSVDNTEAVGALSADAITEDDIAAGRYDDARVTMWVVNWRDVAQRAIRFVGTIGEIARSGGAFQAELRGLTESLNKPQGLVYQRTCSAVLGDHRCRVDLVRAAFQTELAVDQVADGKTFTFATFPAFAAGWFEKGFVEVLDGPAQGLRAHVKIDRRTASGRIVVLWQALRAPISSGDRLKLTAGCDKREATCKSKFDNFVNFRGFPAIPGEDWLMAYPTDRIPNDGGRL